MRPEILKFLNSVSLFKGLKKKDIESIYKHIQEVSIPSFDYIYQSGDPSHYLYIVRYGEISIRLGPTGEKIRYLGQGEVFSEHSILTKSPHYGSAQAVLDTVLYAMSGNAFIQLAKKHIILSQNLINLMSSRMKDVLLTRAENFIVRRLICHIPIEELEQYPDSLKVIQKIENNIQGSQIKILNINHFANMSKSQMITDLARLRRKFPILHVYYDEVKTACSLNHVVMQADQIVVWEKKPELNIKEKQEILKFWKGCVRNFEERSIRMIEDGRALHRQSYAGRNKVFIRKDTMARYLISKTRGIALGGGGARSLAHIGMLKVLEEEGITVDYVSGCSFGAVVGALHARGEDYASIVKIIGKYFGGIRQKIFDPRLPVTSFYKGQNMEKMIREAFGDQKIEDLLIPFVTSAVDLLTGKEYIFDKGPIWEAIVATMSLPGIFPPRRYGDMLLADGGILNNVPDNLIRAKGASLIVSANVSPLEDTEMVSLFEPVRLVQKFSLKRWWDKVTHPPILKIITRAVNLEGRELIRLRSKNMDFVVNYKLDGFSVFDFRRYKKIIQEGEKQFREYLPAVKRMITPGILPKKH